MREIQEIAQAGGLKTVVRGKSVVLKFFIMYVMGDTDGHNEMTNTLKKSEKSQVYSIEMNSYFTFQFVAYRIICRPVNRIY